MMPAAGMERLICIHGHFYQPPRENPWTEEVAREPTAAPAHDWNERITAECYRPNAVAGNYGAMSWDIGPTLASWMEEGDPLAYDGFARGDGRRYSSPSTTPTNGAWWQARWAAVA